MDDPGGDPGGPEGGLLFDAFARLTYRLFGNSFLVVAGGVVGALTGFLVTISVAWSMNAGASAVYGGFIAIPIGYIVAARLVRWLTGGPTPGPR